MISKDERASQLLKLSDIAMHGQYFYDSNLNSPVSKQIIFKNDEEAADEITGLFSLPSVIISFEFSQNKYKFD